MGRRRRGRKRKLIKSHTSSKTEEPTPNSTAGTLTSKGIPPSKKQKNNKEKKYGNVNPVG